MAISQNPLIGVTKKCIGNVIFYRSFNKNILRAKPINYTDKKTPVQLQIRYRFDAALQNVKYFLPLLKYLNWHRLIYNNDRSIYTLALKQFIQMFSYDSNPEGAPGDHVHFNLENFSIGPNEIPSIVLDNWNMTTPGTLYFCWTDNNFNGLIPNDAEIYVCFMNLSKNFAFINVNPIVFSDREIYIELPPQFRSGDRFHFIIFTYDSTNFLCSKSTYFPEPEFIF